MVFEVALAAALSLAQTDGSDRPGEPLLRLRTTESAIAVAIEDGRRGSQTFASLVATVERSHAIVYVARAHTLPHGMEGCLLPSASRTGYLRVLLAIGLPRPQMILVLAHELQHVREVLEAGGGHDKAAFDALFQRIGSRQRGSATGEEYETAAAKEIARIVDREMRDFYRLRRR
jgi:hypothetical protein